MNKKADFWGGINRWNINWFPHYTNLPQNLPQNLTNKSKCVQSMYLDTNIPYYEK